MTEQKKDKPKKTTIQDSLTGIFAHAGDASLDGDKVIAQVAKETGRAPLSRYLLYLYACRWRQGTLGGQTEKPAKKLHLDNMQPEPKTKAHLKRKYAKK